MMKSLVIDRTGHCAFATTNKPSVANTQVLLDIHAVGLCGSDLNTFVGLNPLVSLPRIPGHEIGGTIAAVGADVSPALRPGRSVIVIPYTTCGTCPSCKAGRVNACKFNRTLGVQQDGGLCAQIVVDQDRVIPNDNLPMRQLPLIEPLSVGFHAVDRGRIGAEDTVLVLGGGMIGVGVILGALARGARVIVSEVAEEKHGTLAALGVSAVINPQKDDLAATIARLTDDRGPDVVVEAVGLPETFRAAVDLAAFAGRVVYIGYAKTEVSYNTALFNLKELDIMGSRNATRVDFDAVIAFLEGDGSIADQLITQEFAWEDADQAFGHWQAHRSTTFKILINVSGA